MVGEIVAVLGMHRSGTSLCANLLHALGVNMADTPGISPENARGHWERARVNDLNDQVFAAFGRGWSNSSHMLALPEGWLADARVQSVRANLVAHLAPLLRQGKCGFKDPRTARLMPLWRHVFADLGVSPRYVFCVRDPAQVVRSLSARDKMAAAQAQYRWLLYNAAAVAGVGEDEVCVIPYEAWFSQPEETARLLAAFVGAPPPTADRLSGIIDPSLRHDAPGEPPARLARLLYASIRDAAPEGRFGPDLLALCAAVQGFSQMVQPMLVEAEVLRASVAEQNRVIADLNAAVRQAKKETVLF